MRVALLSHNARRGDAIGNQLAGKVRLFRAHGWEVRLFVQDDAELQPELAALATQHSLRSLWRNRTDRAYLLNADLVSVEYGSYYDLLDVLPALCGRGPRIVFDYRGVTPRSEWPAEDAARLADAERGRQLVWCADLAVVQSEFTARELHEATGFPRARIRQIPCFVDTDWLTPGEPEHDVRGRHGMTNGYVLLFVGRLAANKRPALLLDALDQLRDLNRPVHAVFVGDCSDLYAAQAAMCRRRASEIGVSDRIHLLGRVDDAELRSWYRTADVLVLPSVHEGFGIPVVEAMACGLPVVAACAAALPETIGDAGLIFQPGNADDLAKQIRRVLRPGSTPSPALRGSARIAVVAPRFGLDFVGGAERSLGLIARTLQERGQHVEVFTTCTRHESEWTNELPAGSRVEAGLRVHRFPVDAHDRGEHLAALDRIRERRGRVELRVEEKYLRSSLASEALSAALAARQEEFDALIVGPYLFGLTWRVARAFSPRVLLMPCFHDEPLARLRSFHEAYRQVGGLLYHSPEEQWFAEAELGLNHPNATVIGTVLAPAPATRAGATAAPPASPSPRRIVYCGRYSVEKGVDRLLEFAERCATDHPERFRFMLMGQGSLPRPSAPWLEDLGFVSEKRKQQELARAAALVQLSPNESLALVVLEAWALGVPVIVNRACLVLRAQVRRADGGAAVGSYPEFAAALDHLWHQPERWSAMGRAGREFVERHYRSAEEFAARILKAVANLARPTVQLLKEHGRERAQRFSVSAWNQSWSELLGALLDEPRAGRQMQLELTPQSQIRTVPAGGCRVLIPVRLSNRGDLPAAALGPGRVRLGYVVRNSAGQVIARRKRAAAPATLVRPDDSAIVLVPVDAPRGPGDYSVCFQAAGTRASREGAQRSAELTLRVGLKLATEPDTLVRPFVDSAQKSLAEAHGLQKLPDDYRDVTEGFLANWKRALKRKLLYQFRRSYVDVLSRQQSAFNARMLQVMCQLVDACAALGQVDDAQTGDSKLSRRLRRLARRTETRLNRLERRLERLEQMLQPTDAEQKEGTE